MVSFVSTYRALPALAGSSFLPIAFLARLPSSMVQIGTVVLVSTTFGSVAAGGLAAAGLAIGSAVGGPVIGTLADRVGQRPIVLAASLINAVATLSLVFLVTSLAPMAAVLAAAAVAGASTPQIGPLVRTRWVAMTRGGPTLSTAMSYEGAADETAYIFGPAVVSVLAAIASPSAAMVAAAVLVGVFGVLVAIHPTASFAPQAAPVAGESIWTNPKVIALALAGTAIGCFFGAMQTAVTAVATEGGAAGAAGAVYAVMGIGSAIAALSTTALPAGFSLTNRLWVFAAAIAVLITPLLFVNSILALMIFILPLGAAVGPYIITMYTLGEKVAPVGRLSAVMTLLASGLVIGYSIGSFTGGRLAEFNGAQSAFLAAMVAMTFGTVIALMIRSRRNR
ncbi:MFS transporter [Nakamurella silvestris]|nr:MFS transporter [Nakamurella silvestris]